MNLYSNPEGCVVDLDTLIIGELSRVVAKAGASELGLLPIIGYEAPATDAEGKTWTVVWASIGSPRPDAVYDADGVCYIPRQLPTLDDDDREAATVLARRKGFPAEDVLRDLAQHGAFVTFGEAGFAARWSIGRIIGECSDDYGATAIAVEALPEPAPLENLPDNCRPANPEEWVATGTIVTSAGNVYVVWEDAVGLQYDSPVIQRHVDHIGRILSQWTPAQVWELFIGRSVAEFARSHPGMVLQAIRERVAGTDLLEEEKDALASRLMQHIAAQ